ncbi:MAG: hypothetical protein HZB16_16825 [Armatimonadetes bacterium]|nr:hypothetical protein [Armatimonadota bacterium]
MRVVWLLALLLTPALAQEGDDVPAGAAGGATINGASAEARCAAYLRWCATNKPSKPNYPKEAMGYYAARLILDQDTAYALKGIDAAVSAVLPAARAKSKANPTDNNPGDPFDKHALVNGYLLCPEKIPAATALKIRDLVATWRHREYTGYGAMNYRLMKDGAGYLAAERWPDLVDADGLDAPAIRTACGRRLSEYFRSICTRGLDEYNAPIYFACDLMPVRMIAEFAQDETIRRQAELTLDAMMINLACAWNQGYYVSACSRAKYWFSVATSPDANGSTGGVGWLYFGGRRGIAVSPTGPYHVFWMAWPGRWHLPPLVAEVANDRAAPHLLRQTVASLGGRDIRLQTWHTSSYSLASQWESIPSRDDGLYKEQKRQMLKWVSDKPMSTFAVQQENLLRPYRPKDVTKNAFGYGDNPYEQILQHEATQIALYDVPAAFPFYRLYVPFPLSGAIVRRVEREGWVVCHGGSTLFAYRLVKPGAWGKPENGCDVLWSNERRNAWVLEASELAPYAGGGIDAELARFADALGARTRLDATGLAAKTPRLVYTNLAGHRLDLTYTPHGTAYRDQHRVDGKTVDYRAFPLTDSPWVKQAVGGDTLIVEHGGRRMVWDFGRWTRT